MEKKENTPERIRKRDYETKHKEERKAKNKIWGTSLERNVSDEIDEFLEKHHITKVAVIVAGYESLKKQYETKNDKLLSVKD